MQNFPPFGRNEHVVQSSFHKKNCMRFTSYGFPDDHSLPIHILFRERMQLGILLVKKFEGFKQLVKLTGVVHI